MATYKLDPTHSSISFTVKHMMISKIHGGFEKFAGHLDFDKTHPDNAKAEASIEVSSINTREAQRDAHLKGADFFDVAKFPNMSFKSAGVKAAGNKTLEVQGELTIKGVSKPITLQVEGPSDEAKDPYGNLKIGVAATTKINRKDFGLTWNAALEAGGVLVGDTIAIQLDLQFIKQK